MEKDIFRLIEFYLEKATLSASLILAECRTRVTYEFLNGPYSPKSLCVSGSEIRAWSCLFFVSGRFLCLPAGIYLSYIFPSLSKILYKVKILQIFLCCINLFEARHVIKMLGHILRNYQQFKCTGLLNQFSERLLEVQSFHTHRNPRHMFILKTKEVFCKVYDLKPSTIFLLLRNFSSPSVCSSSLSTEFSYACSYLDSPSLCRRCHPQLFTPLTVQDFSYKTHSLRVYYSQVMFMSSHWSILF